MSKLVWTPQPRQEEFMARSEYEALYGGAAGGGKSDALIIEALRQVHIPHYRALILRKTFPQLAELIDKSRLYYTAAYPKAKYNGTEHCWTFPSGAKIYFGSMHRTQDRINYQGKAYDFIGFDELTHFTWDEYSYMFSRNRPNGPGTIVYMRATTNPGGIGHGWVKQRFITAAPPMTPISEEVEVMTTDGMKHFERDRIFVPATIFDNKHLLANDPNYLATMALLPEQERQALLYGSWDSFSGQVFTEWTNDPRHYEDGRWTHVIDPFVIPKHWTIIRGFDFGFAKPFSVGWFAVDTTGKMYQVAEYYGCTGEPNVGVKINPGEIAAEIKRIEEEDDNLRGHKIVGIADPSIFDESRGESIARMMERHPNRIWWQKGDNHRLAGKMQFHYRLAFNKDGDPMFQTFNTCKHFIRTIPSLVYDERRVEDINTDQEDHIYDMARYVFMEHRISPQKNEPKPVYKEDPLDLHKKENVRFFRM